MSDKNNGLLRRLPQRQQIVVEFEARDFIQRSKGLVHQKQMRLRHQSARDGDTHLHAARQFARIGACEIRQTDTLQSLRNLRPRLDGPDAGQLQRQADILCDGSPGHERWLLKHEADRSRRPMPRIMPHDIAG
jgi:hypothetical protein